MRVTLVAFLDACRGASERWKRDPLSERELEILKLVAGGLSNQQIGRKLFVATSTVKRHMNNIYAKLDVHSRTQAVAKGKELKLLFESE